MTEIDPNLKQSFDDTVRKSELKAELRDIYEREKLSSLSFATIGYTQPDFFAKELTEIKNQVVSFLLQKDSNAATESICKLIKKHSSVYTIRDDNVSEIWIYKDGLYVPNGESFIEELSRNILGVAYTGHLKNKIVDKIKADTYVSKEWFFKNHHPEIIPVLNGLLNLKTGKIIQFSPDYIFFNLLPVEFRLGADCPQIKKFFSEVLKDNSDIQTMQECFGYLLWKKHPYQYAFMLLGSGRNGKSVTTWLMNRLLGELNISSLSLQEIETEPFLLQSIIGKYANICGDISKKALENTGRFKKLTGGDPMIANRKFKPELQFINEAKLIFCCNDLPYSYDDSEGFYDRWIFFDYPYRFVDLDNLDAEDSKIDKSLLRQRDSLIKDKLSTPEELSGLLNWSIEGLHRLWENDRFSYNKTSSENRQKWKRQASSFNAFFEDFCEVDFETFTSSEDLKKAYQSYCRTHKLKFEANKIISAVLESNGCDNTLKRIYKEGDEFSTTVRGWSGLKIVTNVTNVTPFLPIGRITKSVLKGETPLQTLQMLQNPEVSEENLAGDDLD